MCPAPVLRTFWALVPVTTVREEGDNGTSSISVPLANVLQQAAVADIRAESTSPPNPLAPLAAFGCLGCGGLRALRQVPCACHALSTRQVPALAGGLAVTKWKRFVLTHSTQLRPVWGDLPPLLCFSALLATSHWVTTFVDKIHQRKVRAGQFLSVPLRLGGTTWCLWSEGNTRGVGPASRPSLSPPDHEYVPVTRTGQSGVTLGRPPTCQPHPASHGWILVWDVCSVCSQPSLLSAVVIGSPLQPLHRRHALCPCLPRGTSMTWHGQPLLD